MPPKTPLQAIVSVICDALCELPIDDQARALEAARVTLGLSARVSQEPRDQMMRLGEEVHALERGVEVHELVRVEMSGGVPVVRGTREDPADLALRQWWMQRRGDTRSRERERVSQEATQRGYVWLVR